MPHPWDTGDLERNWQGYFIPGTSILRNRVGAQTVDALPEADLAQTVAYLYDYANFAHPFREGNGRSTREFFDLLLSERGVGLDWEKTDLTELHSACHAARAEYDLAGLIAMFAKIVDAEPAYDF